MSFSDIPDPIGTMPSKAPAAVDVAPPKEASPTRAAIQRRRAIAMTLSVGWVVLLIALLGVRPTVVPSVALFHIAIPAALGVVALTLAFSRGRLGLGPSVRNAVLFALVPPAIFVVVGLLFNAPMTADDHRDALKCGLVEGLAGAVSLAIAAVGLARSSVTTSRWRGALIGSALGLVWAGLWGIHCADAGRAHVVLGHGLPVLAFAAIGALVLSRVSRVT